ncbi:MAG: response regulator [Desulfovibrionaceae bacterium]
MSEPIRVLLVDDEMMIRSTLADYLEDEGCIVSEAGSGEDGLPLVGGVDCCIVDMRLPDMNGNEFIMQAHARFPDMRFIIYTGSTDYMLPQALIELGISDDFVFHKPVDDMAILRDQIKRLVAGAIGG